MTRAVSDLTLGTVIVLVHVALAERIQERARLEARRSGAPLPPAGMSE